MGDSCLFILCGSVYTTIISRNLGVALCVWYGMAVQSHGCVWSVGVLCVMCGCDVGVGVDDVTCCLAEEGEGGGEEEEEEDEPEFFTVLYFWQVHTYVFFCMQPCVCLSVCLSVYPPTVICPV